MPSQPNIHHSPKSKKKIIISKHHSFLLTALTMITNHPSCIVSLLSWIISRSRGSNKSNSTSSDCYPIAFHLDSCHAISFSPAAGNFSSRTSSPPYPKGSFSISTGTGMVRQRRGTEPPDFRPASWSGQPTGSPLPSQSDDPPPAFTNFTRCQFHSCPSNSFLIALLNREFLIPIAGNGDR